MRCRVVFPAVKNFPSLKVFGSFVKDIVSEPRKEYDARFFLFPEDILGLYAKALFSGISIEKPVPHEKVLSFIKGIQKCLGPKDFVIFSLYSSIGSLVLNSAYFVGKRDWFFDFKRDPADGDYAIIGYDQMRSWETQAKLMTKSAHCARSGDLCIRGIHLFVCADIELLLKMHFKHNSLCFIPASELGSRAIKDIAGKLRGKGRIFVNDASEGVAWDIPFSNSGKSSPKKLKFGSKICVSVDFEH